ncbi:hypothetical protein FACS1894111_05080 [Clostridia bacterium]|nr:hypothetical protein FACS1894111_05080 [Clostridia bacterium]
MRVTNSMINRSSMTNMNNNKLLVDALNNQMTTQKKINRPSEDPVVAIRALRLRSNLYEVSQFSEKNIPDAKSWLSLTETALESIESAVSSVKALCEKAANDTFNQDDRKVILQNLQGLRTQVYQEVNADYAGRTVFAGYKTNSTVSFISEKEAAGTAYKITEPVSYEAIEEKRYYANQVTVPTTKTDVDPGVDIKNEMPQEVINQRIRLAYDGLDVDEKVSLVELATGKEVRFAKAGEKIYNATGTEIIASGGETVYDKDGKQLYLEKGDIRIDSSGNEIPITPAPTTKTYEDWKADGFAVADDEILFIPETGELILGKDVSNDLKGNKAFFGVRYQKDGFKQGELRPEQYFDCEKIKDPNDSTVSATNSVVYTKENQEFAYMVAFNQTMAINTQASDVFNTAIGRDIDELSDAVEAAIAAHDKVDKIKEMMGQTIYKDADSQKALSEWLEAAQKETDYMDDNMQKLFERNMGTFEGYDTRLSRAISDVGNKVDRLEMTETRVQNQKMTFEELQSDNEDREMSDIILDYTSAYTAYQASLMASSRANKQTLLDYL